MARDSKELILAKMQDADISEAEISTFVRAYDRFTSGARTLLSETEISPVGSIRNVADLSNEDQSALQTTAVLRLNGGIGTTMGLDTPKSLLSAHGSLRFIDIILKQLQALRESHGARLPLILLNSKATERHTKRDVALPENPDGIPTSILQGVVPRLLASSHEPISWPGNPDLEWAPPGHGDLYGVLQRTGLLDQLLASGYKYLFVANADNLGAVPEVSIAAWFAESGADFAAEVVKRTPMDKKGGHFARLIENNRLVLRETAQTPAGDIPYFQDIDRHKYLNTNNLWINLESLREVDGPMGLELPLIANNKHITDEESPEVIQLETAMGSAVSIFAHAELLEVSSSRFLPVKNTSDLLLLRSDVYEFDSGYRLVAQVSPRPVVTLDPAYFGRYRDFEERILGEPSLKESSEFSVSGDVTIPQGYVAKGSVLLTDQV